MRQCEIDGCGRIHNAQGYCMTHYWRLRTYGDPLREGNTRGWSLEDRLRARLVETDTGCWEWTGAMNAQGYGRISTGGAGRSAMAHRVSWELHRGPIPEGLIVCHTCDNPPCCNPDHLFIGAHLDNAADREAKGRNKIHVAVAASSRKRAEATHCKRGHAFDEANTIRTNGRRACRTCNYEARRQWRERQRGSSPGTNGTV